MDPILTGRNSKLIESTNRTGVEFLLTDLDTGLTFLRVAYVTASPEGRTRNLGNAFQAYRTVLRFLPRVVPSPDQQLVIHAKLEELKLNLQKAGYLRE